MKKEQNLKRDAKIAAEIYFDQIIEKKKTGYFKGEKINRIYKSMNVVLIDTPTRKRIRVADFILQKAITVQ